MRVFAIVILFTQLITSTNSFAFERRSSVWKVADIGNTLITNIDVENFIEQTQINDSTKISLFKKAKRDYQTYQSLMSELTQKVFDKAAGKLIYAHLMSEDHRRKHGTRRVAFTTTEQDFNQVVQDNESRVLKDLLNKRVGIVKAREEFGKFLIAQGYPHKSGENEEDVYWRWYKDQQSRIKTELFLKEVKSYEVFIALRNERYYRIDYTKMQDSYNSLKKQVTENLLNKKMSHKTLINLLNLNEDWAIVIKSLSNTQVESAPLKAYQKDSAVQSRAHNILKQIVNIKWDKTVGYHSKISTLLNGNYTIDQLDEMTKDYTQKYIQDKSNHRAYMTGLITKLAAKTKDSSSLPEVYSMAKKINNTLKLSLMTFMQNINSSDSENTLDKEVEKVLLGSINYDELGDIEKAVAELSIFSIKFQIKKSSYENSIPLRVNIAEYMDLETNNALVNHQKHQWMKEEFKSYVRNDLLYKLDYMEVITNQGAHLNDTQKRVLIFGPSFEAY